MSQCGLLSALPLRWKSSYFPKNRAVHPDSLHSRQIAVLPFQLPVPSLQILWEPWPPTAFRNKDGHVEVSPYLSSRNPVLPPQERFTPSRPGRRHRHVQPVQMITRPASATRHLRTRLPKLPRKTTSHTPHVRHVRLPRMPVFQDCLLPAMRDNSSRHVESR